uniref:Uncharacterized protein n=1 Tax=Arundo donax TaxID=35708 RepID=A0A0A9BGT4_ARUDO
MSYEKSTLHHNGFIVMKTLVYHNSTKFM